MKKRNLIFGLLFALLALLLVGGQMGFILLRDSLQIEYIDDRLFYVINIACSLFLWGALVLFLSVTKRQKQLITGLLLVFIFVHGWFMMQSQSAVMNVLSASPKSEHVLVLKHDLESKELAYYRPLYYVFARPMERVADVADEDLSIAWLAEDAAVITYEKPNGKIDQFVATYGYRGTSSYYYVGPEINGSWQGDSAYVRSDTEGITVEFDGVSTLFTYEEIEQYGTLAIVLRENDEAKWTISLNENFERLASASEVNPGDITLYRAMKEKSEPIVLQRVEEN